MRRQEGAEARLSCSFDKPHVCPSGSNSAAEDLAPDFPLELDGICFAAGPENSRPGVVLRGEVEGLSSSSQGLGMGS